MRGRKCLSTDLVPWRSVSYPYSSKLSSIDSQCLFYLYLFFRWFCQSSLCSPMPAISLHDKKKKTWMPLSYSCIYCSVFKPLPCNCSWLTASFVSEELKTHLRLLQAPANLLVHISRCTATHQYRFHTTFPSTLSGGDAQIGLNVSSLMKSQTQQESLRDTAFLTSFRFPLTSFLNLSFPLLSKSLIY